MNECKNCRKIIEEFKTLKCPNCNARFCEDCAVENKNICPYCYSSLEFNS